MDQARSSPSLEGVRNIEGPAERSALVFCPRGCYLSDVAIPTGIELDTMLLVKL